jgi:hypothetical protein
MATPTTLPASFVAGNVLQAAQLNNLRGAFRILQVVSTAKTDTYSASLAQGATSAVTGFTVSITPSSTASKVLVIVSATPGDTSTNTASYLTLTKGGSALFVGDTAGSRQRVSTGNYGGNRLAGMSIVYLDSPATTSSVTYGCLISHATSGTVTCYFNYGGDNSDNSAIARGASTITAMEISA